MEHRRPIPLATRLALSVAAVVITLLLLEAGVRLLNAQDPDFYNSEKFEREGRLIPDSRGNYTGVPVRINSLGMRERDVDVPKPPGVFRVLAIGDSVTFGFGVRLEDSYVKGLERRLNAGRDQAPRRVEVLNTGIPGAGLVEYLEILRTKGPLLEPDLALVGVVLNDIMDYEAAAVPAALGASLADSGLRHLNRTLLLHSHLYLLSYRSAKSLLIRSGGYDLNVAYDSNFLPLRVPSERQARAWASSLRMLDQLVESARALKVPLVLVVFPMEMQLDQPTLDLYRRTLHLTLDASALDGTPQRRLAEFAWARSIAFVDLLPAFRDARGQGLFLRRSGISHDWAHPSPLGHSLAADTILLTLQNLNLVPRRKTT